MKYDAIMFDLDGTLLPMDMKVFTNGYFLDLSKKLEHYNIEHETLVATIWAGTAAMVKNDGSKKNIEAFWEKFYSILPLNDTGIDKECDDFYGNEFVAAKRFTLDNPLAVKAVETARSKADKVILATNPLFPLAGQKTRLSWVNLNLDDFDFVTSYESDSYCKPNPKYFTSVCERMNLDPAKCLLIGNDENEDMYAATEAGLDCYLVTDTMIPSKEHPWEGPKGTFAEMISMLEALD